MEEETTGKAPWLTGCIEKHVEGDPSFPIWGQVDDVLTQRELIRNPFHPILSTPSLYFPAKPHAPIPSWIPRTSLLQAWPVLTVQTSFLLFRQTGSWSWENKSLNFLEIPILTFKSIRLENRIAPNTEVLEVSNITFQDQINSVVKLSGHSWLPTRYGYLNKARCLTKIPVVMVGFQKATMEVVLKRMGNLESKECSASRSFPVALYSDSWWGPVSTDSSS